MSGSPDPYGQAEGLLTQMPRLPSALTERPELFMRNALEGYNRAEGAIAALLPAKREVLGHYDVPGMQNAVSICFWGRSGSFLLASYLDGHDHLVMLPLNYGKSIYRFLNAYGSLSIWDKLLAYPYFSDMECLDRSGDFFTGQFPLAPEQYYAGVHALYALYGTQSEAWLNTSQRFFQFLHAAYAVGRNQRPALPRPLIVYAQHWRDDSLARHFVADFPTGRFIHTVRDPISALDSWFERLLFVQQIDCFERHVASYLSPAAETMRLLTEDCAQSGMETRSRAVRFEDLHLAPEMLMRRLAEWLAIPYRPSLLDSTFNGVPYEWESGGKTWVGANPGNARRRSKNLNAADRTLLFAMLQENFVAWNYPMPHAAHPWWRRVGIVAALIALPMKMEYLAARVVLRRQFLPALKAGRFIFAGGALLFMLGRRVRIMLFVVTQFARRLRGKKPVLRLL